MGEDTQRYLNRQIVVKERETEKLSRKWPPAPDASEETVQMEVLFFIFYLMLLTLC